VKVKLQLTDHAGTNLSSAAVPLTLASPALSPYPGHGTRPPGEFEFVATGGSGPFYEAKVRTGDFKPGTYTLSFTALGDPVLHGVRFVIRRS
jgi:hypothetical protein